MATVRARTARPRCLSRSRAGSRRRARTCGDSAQRSATRIMRSRFLASLRAWSASLGGKKTLHANATFSIRLRLDKSTGSDVRPSDARVAAAEGARSAAAAATPLPRR
jgi:hypothetical protein